MLSCDRRSLLLEQRARCDRQLALSPSLAASGEKASLTALVYPVPDLSRRKPELGGERLSYPGMAGRDETGVLTGKRQVVGVVVPLSGPNDGACTAPARHR